MSLVEGTIGLRFIPVGEDTVLTTLCIPLAHLLDCVFSPPHHSSFTYTYAAKSCAAWELRATEGGLTESEFFTRDSNMCSNQYLL